MRRRAFPLSLAALSLAAAGCAPSSVAPERPPLRIVAPDLANAISEDHPGPLEPQDPVQLAVFHQINADRIANGVVPVAWDEAAARVAAAFTRAQVEEKTRGHFLTDGLPPYARMGLAGVFGRGAENSVSWVTAGREFREPAVTLALEGHARMMEEKPPDDGHRRAILDPDSTHVGVGWWMGAGRFQLAQEFLTRRLESLRLEARGRDTVRISGRTLSGWNVQFATVSWEPRLRLTREAATARNSYAYPAPELALVLEGRSSTLSISGAPAHDRIRRYSERDFAVLFGPDRPGLWTIVFYFESRSTVDAVPGACVVLEAE